LQHSDRRSILKNTGRRGSGRLVGWAEDVFGFSRLLSCLERWRVDQKQACGEAFWRQLPHNSKLRLKKLSVRQVLGWNRGVSFIYNPFRGGYFLW
jgi:hypothetical protein